MSLTHVLLTSLLEKPSTGIELANRFDRSMGFFWHATHQQIYRELGQMQDKGWIIPMTAANSDARKKTYQVTPEGQNILREWLLVESQPAKLRDELMVKLRAEAQFSENTIFPELQRHLELHKMQLAVYQAILKKDQQKPASSDQRTIMIQQKILELGIQLEQGWISWLNEMIIILEQHPHSS